MQILECELLTKEYRGKAAVCRLSLTVAEAEIFGLLGPNGAGKTTLFRMLLGLARPSGGSARVMGHSVPSPSRIQHAIGAVVEEPAFYKWMNGAQALRQHAMAVGYKPGPREVEATLDRVGLSDAGSKPIKKYSQGMRQRLGLARATLHRPDLVILDEPANGLDPAGIVWLRGLLRELADNGTTVVVSSHQLGEIERVCDRVAIIARGRLVDVGRVGEIGSEGTWVRVSIRPEDREAAAPVLTFLEAEERGDGFFVKNVASRNVLRALVTRGVYPLEVAKEQASLEKRFLEITGGVQ